MAWRVVGLLGTLLLLGSCSLLEPHSSVVQGNYAYGQGDYQSATVAYLRALDEEEFDSFIQYNLANVYHALGESGAAFELWNRAADGADEELLFRISFNKGVAHYELGEYGQAFEELRNALTIKSSSVAAKRNLELTLRKLRASQSVQEVSTQTESAEGDRAPSAEALRVLEYMRRKEEQRWFASENAPTEESVKDW
jgi:tetratricopeptide (TPR) repeat protein